MAKALEANDNTAQNQEHQAKELGDKSKRQGLQGKSIQVNQNSLHEGDPIDSSTTHEESK